MNRESTSANVPPARLPACLPACVQVDKKYTGASFLFNWLDQDGSVVKHVQPNKPSGPYLITSHPAWWKLSDTDSWTEPRCGTGTSYLPNPLHATFIDSCFENAHIQTVQQRYRHIHSHRQPALSWIVCCAWDALLCVVLALARL